MKYNSPLPYNSSHNNLGRYLYLYFSTLVNTFPSDIDVVSGSTVIDAKSLLGLYSLDLSKDISIRIISDNMEEKRRFDSEMEAFR